MTAFSTLAARLGWSAREIARRLGISERTARYWAEGRNSRGGHAEPPAEVLQWLQACADAVGAVPVPMTSKRADRSIP